MKNNYIKPITFVALVSILLLQGGWLYNTYKLLETEFKENISSLFIRSLEKEVILRIEDPAKKGMWKQKVIAGVRMENDHYTNNRAFQDYLYIEDYPIFLEKADSIFNEEIKKTYESLDYSLLLIDSLGNHVDSISHGYSYFNEYFSYKETVQLRNLAPEYITLTVFSPHKIIFGKMLLLLIGSLVLAVIVLYGLLLQIKIIARQKRIAELRQDFTHAMVHDMKSPLTTILMGIRSLKSGKMDDKPQMKEQHYAIITQEGERMLGLANKILEIAQFEGQQVILSKQSINLSDLIRSLTEKYKLNVTKNVHFHIESGVEYIYADPHYIAEAFGNIIDNAIKYSKENEDAEIYITSSYENNTVRMTFKDNGTGISPKDQQKIFRKFERADSVIRSKKKISGFGLGLTFVSQVIKAHSGEIKVNSRLGSFSEFIINLPYDENDKIIID
jgi:two-component system phosphate regulon sensor histidine kinase PhoR